MADVLNAGSPHGSCILDPNPTRPVVFVSAGVGLTPMVAMLHALAGSETPVIFVHGARDGEHHSLRDEVRTSVQPMRTRRSTSSYSRPGASDVAGRDYHSTGRLQPSLLEKLLPGLDADFYRCGPAAFLADLQRGLGDAGVPVSQIHSESF